MPLPELPSFENFLNALTFDKPNEELGWHCILVKPERETDDEEDKPIHLWVKDQPELSMLAFVKRFSDEFGKTDHPIEGDLVTLVLAIFATFNKFSGTRVNLFNKLLQFNVPVDVTHFRIYSKMETPGRFEWNGYKVGLLDWDKLQYKCSRAKLEFCNVYGSELKDCYTLESPVFRRVAIDWKSYGDFCIAKHGTELNDVNIKQFIELFNELATYYYVLLGHYLHKQMLKDLEVSQDLLSVFDLRIIDARRFSVFEPKHRISVYQNFGTDNKTTMFAADTFRLKIEFGPITPIDIVEQFEKEYGLYTSSKNEIHNIIRAMCRSIHEGKKAMDRGAYSEGLLNYVIALEILFSEKNSANDSVASRTAAVVHRVNQKSYTEMRKEVLELYEDRSNYVHKGYSIKYLEAERAGEIAKEVVSCLLRLQKNPRCEQEYFPKKWLKELDLIKAGFDAERPADDKWLLDVGIDLGASPMETRFRR